jgi:hypothetical protein
LVLEALDQHHLRFRERTVLLQYLHRLLPLAVVVVVG